MIAFTASTPFATKSVALSSSFTKSLDERTKANVGGVRMALRAGLAKSAGLSTKKFGGIEKLMSKADEYMAQSVQNQYYAMSQPSGVYGVQCTEGSVKHAAEVARVRVLNNRFRAGQASPSAKYGSMYEYRLSATYADRLCAVEAKQFSSFSNLAKTYCLARAEALGTCDRYATPESVEEAAMARYFDIQQKMAVNPTGVYNSSCVEGSCKDAAEDLRVATLAAAYRNAQKPVNVLLQEKYNQRMNGYVRAHGCEYEESLITRFPAVGAAFRPKAYGY